MSNAFQKLETYFVYDEDRERVPDGCSVCRVSHMSESALRKAGFGMPVPFSKVRGKYWWVEMDAAAKWPEKAREGDSDRCSFHGVMSTEKIREAIRNGQVRVIDGPFDSERRADYVLEGFWEPFPDM